MNQAARTNEDGQLVPLHSDDLIDLTIEWVDNSAEEATLERLAENQR